MMKWLNAQFRNLPWLSSQSNETIDNRPNIRCTRTERYAILSFNSYPVRRARSLADETSAGVEGGFLISLSLASVVGICF